MGEEIDLFEALLEEKNYKSILLNGETVPNNFVLFDSQKYTKCYGCTYSVTPSAIKRYLSNFQEVSLIVGIGDLEIQSKAKSEIDLQNYLVSTNIQNGIDFWSESDDCLKTKIMEKRFHFYGVNPVTPIHSKFFLLENPDTKEKRIILGSANLTERGLLKNTTQYEDIFVWEGDDSFVQKLFDTKYRRFHSELIPETLPYIDEKLIKIYQKNMDQGKDPIILKKEITEIQTDRVLFVNKYLEGEYLEGRITSNFLKDLKSEAPVLVDTENTQKKEREIRLKILENMLQLDKKKNVNFMPQKQQSDIVKQYLELKVTKDKNSVERFRLERNDRHDKNHIEGNFIVSNEEGDLPFSKKISTEERQEKISMFLSGIESFVESYVKYTNLSIASKQHQLQYQKKIYEAILFAFTTPFLSFAMKLKMKDIN